MTRVQIELGTKARGFPLKPGSSLKDFVKIIFNTGQTFSGTMVVLTWGHLVLYRLT